MSHERITNEHDMAHHVCLVLGLRNSPGGLSGWCQITKYDSGLANGWESHFRRARHHELQLENPDATDHQGRYKTDIATHEFLIADDTQSRQEAHILHKENRNEEALEDDTAKDHPGAAATKGHTNKLERTVQHGSVPQGQDLKADPRYLYTTVDEIMNESADPSGGNALRSPEINAEHAETRKGDRETQKR